MNDIVDNPEKGTKICRWPDGDTREVIVTGLSKTHARIIWNESYDPIPGTIGCVTGLDDIVPIEWLS